MDSYLLNTADYDAIESALRGQLGTKLVSVDAIAKPWSGGRHLGVTTKGMDNGALFAIVEQALTARYPHMSPVAVRRDLMVWEEENGNQVSWANVAVPRDRM